MPSPDSLVIARGKWEILLLFSLAELFLLFELFFFQLLPQWKVPIAASMTDKTEEGSSVLPVRYWGLNPLFWSHMKMFVKEVQSLAEYSDYKGTWCKCFKLNRYEPIIYIFKTDEAVRTSWNELCDWLKRKL